MRHQRVPGPLEADTFHSIKRGLAPTHVLGLRVRVNPDMCSLVGYFVLKDMCSLVGYYICNQ